MRRPMTVLGGLLAAQLTLAALLHLTGSDDGRAESASPLAAFQPEQIDTIRIADGSDAELRLTRADDDWRLPASDGFPAEARRVERLLDQLRGFDAKLPVARTERALERFSVDPDGFERRVELLAGGETVATALFGGSAGTDRVYARAAGADTIYEVSFQLWQASTRAAEWYDTDYAGVRVGAVRDAALPAFRLRRARGGDWQLLASGGEPETVPSSRARTLVRRLARPEPKAVAQAEAPSAKATVAYTLTTDDGEPIRFRYFAADGGGAARLYRSDQPWRYEVPAKRLAKLQQAAPEKLLAAQDGGAKSSGGGERAGAS